MYCLTVKYMYMHVCMLTYMYIYTCSGIERSLQIDGVGDSSFSYIETAQLEDGLLKRRVNLHRSL